MKVEAKRERLALIEREIAGLGARHDLAMSAFKFDEAREVQRRIAVLERERAELVGALPAAAAPSPAPVTTRQRRLVLRRRRPLHRR